MSPMPPLITAASARQRIADDGLSALGLTMPLLSPSWSLAVPSYDATALTLTMPSANQNGDVRPPFLGLRTWVGDLQRSGLYDVSGLAMTGIGAVLRLHPQAARRLETLAAARLGSALYPVPHTALVRCATNVQTTAQWFGPGTSLDLDPGDSGTLSFHDERGLIIDPIAVAALFSDLVAGFPALSPAGVFAGAGTLAAIVGNSTGTLVQIVDPHGAPWPAGGTALSLVDPSSQTVGPATLATPPLGAGMLALQPGQGLAPPAPILGSAGMRLGWARNATLGRTAIFPPVLPAGVNLPRRFLRACAVDLDWHLLGNRGGTTVDSIGPSDDASRPAQFMPVVRDRVRVDLLVDGNDVLAAAGQVLAPLPSGWTGDAFVVSPAIDTVAGVGVPPAPGAPGHWPAFPAAPAGPMTTQPPDAGITAHWSGPRDVIVGFPGNSIPAGSHVRVYPQVFVQIASIGPSPSFLRGDGAATVVPPGPFSLLLTNPLGLDDTDNQPPNSVLIFDLVVADRAGNARTFGNIAAPVTATPFLPPPADIFGAPDPLGGAAAGVILRAVAPSPVFGIPGPPPVPPIPPPADPFLDMLRKLASEGSPRIGPRLPTMARFPTLVAVGTDAVGSPRTWDAIVSGGRWTRETRSAGHARANPGNPAGPDVNAAGVRLDGAAAFDVAQIALRRAQALLPFATSGASLGWIPILAKDSWAPTPEPGSDAAPPGQAPLTCAAAVLRSVAIGCETPEIAVLGDPGSTASLNNLLNNLVAALGLPLPPFPPGTLTADNEQRIVDEIRREYFTNTLGHRDAQWALRRALRQARDLVFLCSPQFAPTYYPPEPESPGDPPPPPPPLAPHEVDLVAELAQRMGEQRSLLVLVCVPRWPDPDPLYGGWIRQAFNARNAALKALTDVDPARVVAFHPSGFPGRHVALRSTVVVVDDVWALVGSSHLRRRGMTFDEGVDVATIDRALDAGGASTRIRTFRQSLLAALTGVSQPAAGATDPEFTRLAGTRSCVDLVADLVAQGGFGRLSPFWTGPTDPDVLVQSNAVADPDGGTKDEFLLRFASLIGESAG